MTGASETYSSSAAHGSKTFASTQLNGGLKHLHQAKYGRSKRPGYSTQRSLNQASRSGGYDMTSTSKRRTRSVPDIPVSAAAYTSSTVQRHIKSFSMCTDNGRGDVTKQRRTSLVRYRSRKGALRRNFMDRRQDAPPSRLAENVLLTQGEQTQDASLHWSMKIIPHLYTFYVTYLLDIYTFIRSSHCRAGHSFTRWTLSCALVTTLFLLLCMTVLCVGVQLLAFVTFLAAAAAYFVFLLVLVTLLTICCILIMSFSAEEQGGAVSA